MPLMFEMSDEEKDKVVDERMKKIGYFHELQSEVEQYLESQGGMFIGINDSDGLVFGFKDEAFDTLKDKIFTEDKT